MVFGTRLRLDLSSHALENFSLSLSPASLSLSFPPHTLSSLPRSQASISRSWTLQPEPYRLFCFDRPPSPPSHSQAHMYHTHTHTHANAHTHYSREWFSHQLSALCRSRFLDNMSEDKNFSIFSDFDAGCRKICKIFCFTFYHSNSKPPLERKQEHCQDKTTN